MNTANILIIEDNDISRKVLRLCLESAHYTVVEAADGATALNEATKQKFDLIIQDLVLPDIDGISLNKKLREIPAVRNIPIFALSGFLRELDKDLNSSGFTTLLLKPMDPLYLLDVVKAHLPNFAEQTISGGNGRNILIVDDNPIQLKLFKMQLNNAGFHVTTALDGELALKEAIKRPPDAIITDIIMPNIDGFDLCVEIKRNANLRNIPIILLTSNTPDAEDLALAKWVGASCYLTRTPDEKYLVTELLKLLNSNPSLSYDVPEILRVDIKEQHIMRSIRKLEQQVLENAKLAQRCAILVAQLSLSSSIENALINNNFKTINDALQDALHFCLDATGISKGALYIKQSDHSIKLCQQLGFPEDQKELVSSFFGMPSLMTEIIKQGTLITMPSDIFSVQIRNNFLNTTNVNSAIIVPLFFGTDTECLGVLFLGSDMTNLTDKQIIEFVRTLSGQIAQSIALANVFSSIKNLER